MSRIMDKEKYIPRIIDAAVERYLATMGAVCIEGPKWCGETLALTAPKVMFHRLKHILWHSETIPLAWRNLTFGKFIFCKLPIYR